MKKIWAFLLTLCLLCNPIMANAESIAAHDTVKETIISCTVPSSHKITVEAKNSKVLIDGKIADSFDVERLQSPKLQIVADKGYVIKKVVYNGVDVTEKLTDGYFIAEGIFKESALVVESVKSSTILFGVSPETGDTSSINLWIIILLVSVLSLLGIVITKKRKAKNV